MELCCQRFFQLPNRFWSEILSQIFSCAQCFVSFLGTRHTDNVIRGIFPPPPHARSYFSSSQLVLLQRSRKWPCHFRWSLFPLRSQSIMSTGLEYLCLQKSRMRPRNNFEERYCQSMTSFEEQITAAILQVNPGDMKQGFSSSVWILFFCEDLMLAWFSHF